MRLIQVFHFVILWFFFWIMISYAFERSKRRSKDVHMIKLRTRSSLQHSLIVQRNKTKHEKHAFFISISSLL